MKFFWKKNTTSYKLQYVSIEVHSRQTSHTLEFKSATTKQNLRKETKPTIFEQTQIEPKKYDFMKKIWFYEPKKSPTLNNNEKQLHLQLQ